MGEEGGRGEGRREGEGEGGREGWEGGEEKKYIHVHTHESPDTIM